MTPPPAKSPFAVRLWQTMYDPLGLLARLEADYGDIVMLQKERIYAVFSADYVKHILQDNHPNYAKGERYRSALAPLMGNGLFTSEGAFWLRQRRLAQGAFQRAHLASFVGPISACVSDAIEVWLRKARHGEPISLREEITKMMLHATLRILFSTDAELEMPELIEAIFEVNEEIKLGAVFLPVHLPKWLPTPARRRFARSLRTINNFLYDVIARRKAAPEPGDDLVGLLVKARYPETGSGMDDLQLRDELVSMLNGGHDTVTDAISWTMILLARHPGIKEQVRNEVLRVAGTACPTVESLQQMELLGRVFHESLRLYPPAWGFARTALQPDFLGKYRIPPGSFILMSPYAMHRSRRFWENPEEFDPDRFLPARSAERPKFAYFPFGAGPRQCIGAFLVMMEAPLVLASLLQRIDFEIPEAVQVKADPRISLRPKGTVWMKVRAQQPETAGARATGSGSGGTKSNPSPNRENESR